MAISVVQVKPFPDASSGSFNSPTTAGNTVVIAVLTGSNSNVAQTVTGATLGGAADNFAQAEFVQSAFSSGTATVALWVDPNCAGGQTAVAISGTNLVFTVGSGNGIIAYEISGLVSTSSVAAVLDAHTHNSGTTGTAVTTGTTAATAQPNEIALTASTAFQTQSGFTAGYTVTSINDGTGVFGVSGSLVRSATGTQSFAGTAAGSTVWAGCIITLKGAAAADVPRIQPGPMWFDLFKPGLPKPRPFVPVYIETEQGPLNVVLPVPLLSMSGTDVNPASVPIIQPGPAWLDQFKPGMRKPRPQQPVYPYRTAGEQGPLNIILPVPLIGPISGTNVNPSDFPSILPGPAWLDQFKPGLRRNRPPVPPDPGVKLITAPLAVVLPTLVTSLSGTRLRQPENLGAVLTLPSPDGGTVEVVESATCTLADYAATLVLPTFSATLVGWTMLTAPLTLSEFNDVTIDIAITQNGSPYNLTGVTVNLLFKTAAGTPDANALIFSSGGGSPAITITNAAGGLAVAVIPNTDLDAEVYFFYRLDVVNAGLTNTTLYGPINWISL